MSFTPPTRQDHGVVLALFPATSGFALRVERAPDDGQGAPYEPDAQDLGVADPDTRFFFDRLPPDGLVRWYRVRHWRSGYDESPPTCWKPARPAVIPEALFDPQPVAPELGERTREENGVGTLELVVTDPQCRVTEVAWKTQVYGEAGGEFTAEPTVLPVHTFTVPLDPKHVNAVTYRVTFYDAQAQLRRRERTVAFDVDTLPTGLQIEVTVPADRVPRVRLRGDSDTGSWRVAGKASLASYPTLAEVRDEPAWAGREVEVLLAGLLVEPGQSLLVTALPYTASDGTGTEGEPLQAQWNLPQPPAGSMDVTLSADGTATLHLTGQAGVASAAWAAGKAGYVEAEPPVAVPLSPGQSLDEVLPLTLDPGETVYVTAWLYAGAAGTGQVVGPLRKSRTYARSDFPQIDGVNWDAAQEPHGARALGFRVVDPRGLGGELRVWVNPAGPESPDPALPPDGRLTVGSTPAAVPSSTAFTLDGGGTAQLLASIPQNARVGKRIYLEFVNAEGVGSGRVTLTVPHALWGVDENGDFTVAQLSDLTPDAGLITAGLLRGGGTAVGWVDLDAAGSDPFLHHPALDLGADGAGVFRGGVELATAGTGHVDVGSVRLAPLMISASDQGAAFTNAGTGEYLRLHAEQVQILVPDDPEPAPPPPPSGGPGLEYPLEEPPPVTYHTETVTNLALSIEAPATARKGLLFPPGSLLQLRSTSLGTATLRTWSIRATDGATRVDSDTHWDTLDLVTSGGANTGTGHQGVKYSFRSDGHAFSDAGWSTFSPRPPRAAEEMGAADWLEWAVEDARKPVKPYAGIPDAGNPHVAELARAHGRRANDVAREEHERYAKDVSKIAIGTARWAHAVHRALAGARDFGDFRRRLEGYRG